MQKMIALLLAVLMLLSACGTESSTGVGATREKDGVPDSQVLSYLQRDYPDLVDIQIQHDIDLDAHTDNITVTAKWEHNCATDYLTFSSLVYQYTKSDDLWNMIQSYTVSMYSELHPEAYVGLYIEDNVSGKAAFSHGTTDYYYRIEITDADTENRIIYGYMYSECCESYGTFSDEEYFSIDLNANTSYEKHLIYQLHITLYVHEGGITEYVEFDNGGCGAQ